MASRKDQKEQARQRRLAEEQALAERVRRQRRLQMMAGAVIAAVAVIAVAIAVSSSGGNGTGTGLQHGKTLSQTEQQVSQLLSGIPQNGTTLGDPKAPVTLVYYGDLECPVCRDFTLQGGFPQLISNDVRQGKVKVIYRSFCTATCNNHPQSVFNQQQVAAYSAGLQKLFWNYAELFYRQQQSETTDYVNTAFLNALAEQIPNLNLKTWQKDLKDPSLLGQVQADGQQASSIGVSGTPTLIAKGPKGEQPVGATVPSYSDLEAAIKQVT